MRKWLVERDYEQTILENWSDLVGTTVLYAIKGLSRVDPCKSTLAENPQKINKSEFSGGGEH